MNAFLIYSIKRRRELSAENPTLTTSEISTILGDEWAKMDQVSFFSSFYNFYIIYCNQFFFFIFTNQQ